ncbi:MAG: SDR family oxidoreductase, partial [Acidobacteria bacterium]|nr:SDR family oxidoreductase [Acidobacteriota bacterium]
AVVVVNDIHETGELTSEEIRQLGRESLFLRADVSNRAEVQRMVEQADQRFGRIDILVNNAGIGTAAEHRRPIHEFDEAEWHRILNVDLNSLYYCCRAVSPGMVARRAGNIINIASVMGLVPIRRQIPYAAAKAGVINFSRSAALELGPFGIRVNAIAPGSTLTEGTRTLFYNPERKALAESLLSHIPLGRPATPEDIAPAALFLASPDASYITGAVITVDGGWTAGFARDW